MSKKNKKPSKKQEKTTSPFIKVKVSRIHSTGVFAKIDIPEGTRIIEYVGDKVTKKESDNRAQLPLEMNADNEENGAVYIFQLNKKHDIDGNVSRNTARFINHSCDPNCETDIIRGKIWIIAIKDIKRGEELAYNYNYDWEDYEDHECYCGSSRCVGYILAEEFWPKLRRKQKKLALKKKNKKKKSSAVK